MDDEQDSGSSGSDGLSAGNIFNRGVDLASSYLNANGQKEAAELAARAARTNRNSYLAPAPAAKAPVWPLFVGGAFLVVGLIVGAFMLMGGRRGTA